MNNKCEAVIISDKAYNAIIRESFAKHPVETGGILLGYIHEDGLWVVMEMIPPGINGVFERAYFEYDREFVNYLGTSVANQYKKPLQVLGLWHRHPGSMDYFSSTDDGTNAEFASRNPYGVISGLVNIDPSFRLTMYHLDHNNGDRSRKLPYSTVDVEVGDDLIPDKYFALRYIDEERSELHPIPTNTNTKVSKTRSVPQSPRNGSEEETFDEKKPEENKDSSSLPKENVSSSVGNETSSAVTEVTPSPTNEPRNRFTCKRTAILTLVAIAVFAFIAGLVFLKIKPSAASNMKDSEKMNSEQINEEQAKPVSPLSGLTKTWSYIPYSGEFKGGDDVIKVNLDFISNEGTINEAILLYNASGKKIRMNVEESEVKVLKLYDVDNPKKFTIKLNLTGPEKLTGQVKDGEKEYVVELSQNKAGEILQPKEAEQTLPKEAEQTQDNEKD